MTNDEILQGTNQYLMANYGRLPVATVKAAGSTVWDATGKEYVDLFAGFGAGGLGHCHPAVVEAIRRAAGEMMAVGNLFTWESQVELAAAIVRHGFGGKVFFCHSGAEANEAALKIARLAAGAGRYKMICFESCFHGRTMGSLSLTAKAAFKAGFEPMLEGAAFVPMGDLDAVAAAIDEQTAGVIIEPIQGEGGINVPEAAFMQGLRALCDEHKLTLICDEVWTGPARTGQWYGHQLHGITPDIMTLGKAIGGGVPLAACVAGGAFADVLTPGTHGCTLGGNPLCASAGAAVYKVIEDEDLVARAAAMGAEIVKTINDAGISRVKAVRGCGLMIGIQLDGPAKDVFDACLENGAMINVTNGDVVRLAPPLTIGEADLEKGLAILIDAMKA